MRFSILTSGYRYGGVLVVAALLLWFSGMASKAHFLLNLNVRIVHVEHTADGLRAYIRTPMPYLVADKIGEAPEGELPAPAPYTSNAFEEDVIVHFVNFDEFTTSPKGLGDILEQGFSFAAEGGELKGVVQAVRLYAVGQEPRFATLDEARAAFAADPTRAETTEQYVGDTIVDVEIFFPVAGGVSEYSLSSDLDPGLPGQEETANLILDYGPGNPKIFRSRGLLEEPIVISRSPLTAIATFVWEGVRHILEGIDHVLFVVCLVIGAHTLRALLWRVTGFTIGHSVTLAIGFFGFVPSAAWFIPAVETGIALSIIYAAVLALWTRSDGDASNVQMFIITVAIGLLHGLGFSFVLQEILQVTSPNIWQSLLAFNVGVELGQVTIVLVVWSALFLVQRISDPACKLSKAAIALACVAIAGGWTVERLAALASTL